MEAPADARLSAVSVRRSGARERLVVDLGEACEVDVGVALGRREACVTEQLLDRAQVCAGIQEMGREGVAERVRARADPSLGAADVPLLSVAARHREALGEQARQWGLTSITASMQILAESKMEVLR